MITKVFMIDGDYVVVRPDGDIRKRNEYWGKSSDPKPVNGAQNADIFYEMDTKRVFVFCEDTSAWIEQ